jgi:16S rRNA (guanine966-N2)-methyltransferase
MAKNRHGQMHIVAGEDRGRRLASPADDRIRPTPGMAREAIGSILQDILPGSDFLDLYAGTGSVGLEALSRGARLVTLVEQDREAVALIKANIQMMSRPGACHLMTASVFEQCRAFERIERRFDLVFIDPPYDTEGITLRKVEPILKEEGILIHQRPEKFAVGDPFKGTRLELYDTRRYGKAEFTFWRFPLPEPDGGEEPTQSWPT